jgi:hypothetical protein
VTDDIELRVAIKALKRLADRTEIAGMGDVEDPEGLARIRFARAALASIGYSHKVKEIR